MTSTFLQRILNILNRGYRRYPVAPLCCGVLLKIRFEERVSSHWAPGEGGAKVCLANNIG